MKALTWHGKRDVRVDNVPDPTIQEPNDAIVRITTTNICGSDLHLYEVLGPFIDEGDILGHEPMGIVEEVGPEVANLAPGDRVVLPFNISCGHCFMCDQRLYSQCETTQVHEYGTGAKFFGYTKLYGQAPGGQAEFPRVPQAQFVPFKVPAAGASNSRESLRCTRPQGGGARRAGRFPARPAGPVRSQKGPRGGGEHVRRALRLSL